MPELEEKTDAFIGTCNQGSAKWSTPCSPTAFNLFPAKSLAQSDDFLPDLDPIVGISREGGLKIGSKRKGTSSEVVFAGMCIWQVITKYPCIKLWSDM